MVPNQERTWDLNQMDVVDSSQTTSENVVLDVVEKTCILDSVAGTSLSFEV